MKIIAIRHLPTPWNMAGLLQGSKDISILDPSEEIRQTIVENKKVLEGLNFDRVFHSELARTRETAEAYGYTGAVSETLLNEFNFGKYEGAKKEDFLSEQGETWKQDPTNIVLGESGYEFAMRIKKFLGKYIELERLLVFGHGAYIRGLLSIEKHGDISNMNQMHVENNQLVEMQFSASHVN